MKPLNERQRFALLWLDKRTKAGVPLYSGSGAMAHFLGSAMAAADLLDPGRGHKRNYASQGAANVLVALKRRGLATNSTPGGEAFQSVEWGITEAGHELATQLRDREQG